MSGKASPMQQGAHPIFHLPAEAVSATNLHANLSAGASRISNQRARGRHEIAKDGKDASAAKGWHLPSSCRLPHSDSQDAEDGDLAREVAQCLHQRHSMSLSQAIRR
jgi:hypothetical protein